MKTHYFVLTTEHDQVICTIQNNGCSQQFKEAIEEAFKEHYTLKFAEAQGPVNVNNFIGLEQQLTLTGKDDDGHKLTDTINIISVHLYGNPQPVYQVVNKSGNPAGREGNQDAIFLSEEQAQAHIDFLVEDCALNGLHFFTTTL